MVTTVPDGYQLALGTDLAVQRSFAIDAETALADADLPAAFDITDRALAMGAGVAYPDLDHLPEIEAARRAAHAVTLAAEDLRLEAGLDPGRASPPTHGTGAGGRCAAGSRGGRDPSPTTESESAAHAAAGPPE